MTSQRRASWLPWLSLAAFTFLWIARWPSFPLVLDPYYHLLIGRQIAEANGPLLYEWWEYAPGGRLHLYPPVLHVILATLLRLGIAPITSLRLLNALGCPLLLLTIFLVMRRLTSFSEALACLWTAMLPFAFHLHTAITMAATIGLIELLWLMVAVEEHRPVAAGTLLALLCYTHLGLPWIALLMLGCYALLCPTRWRHVVHASWGLGLAIPWWLHLYHGRTSIHVFPRIENQLLEIVPGLVVMAAIGFWRSLRTRGTLRWMAALWVGFLLLAPHHTYRWLTGEGMLPTIVLAGVGMVGFAKSLTNRAPERGAQERPLLILAVMWGVLMLSPTIARTLQGWRWLWPDSAPWHLLHSPLVTTKEIDNSLDTPQLEDVVTLVATHSHPGEILWSNASYAVGLVAALTNHPISSAMLNEVTPTRAMDPIRAAHLIVWFKMEPLPGDPTWQDLMRYPLTRVAENDMAILLRNMAAGPPAHVPVAVLPLWGAVGLLAVAIGVIVGELRSARQAKGISV